MENSPGLALSRTFAALSEPSRRAMLARLERNEDLTVSELARHLPIKLPAVLKHLAVLSEAGLIVREKRGRTVNVRLRAEPLKEVTDWLVRYERFWTCRLDLIAELAEASESATIARSSNQPEPAA